MVVKKINSSQTLYRDTGHKKTPPCMTHSGAEDFISQKIS
jgi:hypothetical protein